MRSARVVTAAFLISSSVACLKKNEQFHQGGARVAPKEASAGADAKATEPESQSPGSAGSAAPKTGGEEALQALTDAEAVAYLKEACASCHDSQSGAVASFWSLRASELSSATLASDEMAANVYYALLAKS